MCLAVFFLLPLSFFFFFFFLMIRRPPRSTLFPYTRSSDLEIVDDAGLRGKLRELAKAVGVGRDGEPGPRESAMLALAARLDADVREGNDRLIALHALGGHAREEILTRLGEHYAVRERVSEAKAAVWGGAITGALAGLKADLVSGGLTLGGGLLLGGVLGALGAAGLARGVNLDRGTENTWVAWTDDVLLGLAESSLLTYLAIAHYGRGRGDWTEGETPAHWQPLVHEVLAQSRAAWQQALAQRDKLDAQALAPLVEQAARAVLARLYPEQTARPQQGGHS